MRVRTNVIAVAALAVGMLFGRLTAPGFSQDEQPEPSFASAQLTAHAASPRGAGAVSLAALEVPDIVGAGVYERACETWDAPPLVILPSD